MLVLTKQKKHINALPQLNFNEFSNCFYRSIIRTKIILPERNPKRNFKKSQKRIQVQFEFYFKESKQFVNKVLGDPVKKEKYDKYGTVDENEFDFEEFMKEFNEGIFGDIFSGIDEEFENLFSFFTKPSKKSKKQNRQKKKKKMNRNLGGFDELETMFQEMLFDNDEDEDDFFNIKKNKNKKKAKKNKKGNQEQEWITDDEEENEDNDWVDENEDSESSDEELKHTILQEIENKQQKQSQLKTQNQQKKNKKKQYETTELKELEDLFGIPSFDDEDIYFPMFVAENSIEQKNGSKIDQNLILDIHKCKFDNEILSINKLFPHFEKKHKQEYKAWVKENS